MAEKVYTPRQVTVAVLEKVTQLLQKSEVANSLKKAANPDKEADAELGEKIEHDVEQHMKENRSAERAEGHEMAKHGLSPAQIKAKMKKGESMEKHGLSPEQIKAKMKKCEGCGEIYKAEGESKHDRCVRHVKENSPGVDNPHAVCVAEGVRPAAWGKSEELAQDFENLKALLKYEPENNKKLGYKLSEAGKEEKQPEASDNAFKVKSGEASTSPDQRLAEQKDPQHNTKEQAEGNNELAGTTPTQVGQDGKNKPGYDEMKGHLKLAKFIGRMEHKRTSKKPLSSEQSQTGAEAQHKESIKDKSNG